jgi:hypothetical protein
MDHQINTTGIAGKPSVYRSYNRSDSVCSSKKEKK